MTVKNVEKLEKSRVAVTVEVGAEEFEAAVAKAYTKARSKLSIPGFRPGKAPRKMIEKLYGAGVFYSDAVDIVLPDAYTQAIGQSGLNVVGYPEIEIVDDKIDENGFTFKATIAVYPEVKLGEYKGLTAEKEEVKVSADDVKERLNEMAERNARLVSVDRKAKKGDIAVIDFEGFDNGEAFEGGKGENYELELGSGSFVPGFEDQVIGMKAGDEKDLDITFPEDYHAENLAGKPVVFKVKVHAITEENVPELNDEFVQDISECSTVDEYTAYVRGDLEKRAAERAKNERTDLILQKVIDNAEVEIHGDIVSAEVDMQIDRFDKQLQSFGADLKSYLEYAHLSIEDMRKDYEQAAQRQLKSQYVMMAIIDAEKLEPTDEDFREVIAMSDTAKQQHWDDEKIDAELKDNRMKYAVSALYNAAVKMLVANAVVPAAAPAEEAPAAE